MHILSKKLFHLISFYTSLLLKRFASESDQKCDLQETGTHPLLNSCVLMFHFSLLHGCINHQLVQLKVGLHASVHCGIITQTCTVIRHTAEQKRCRAAGPESLLMRKPRLSHQPHAGSLFGNEALIQLQTCCNKLATKLKDLQQMPEQKEGSSLRNVYQNSQTVNTFSGKYRGF